MFSSSVASLFSLSFEKKQKVLEVLRAESRLLSNKNSSVIGSRTADGGECDRAVEQYYDVDLPAALLYVCGFCLFAVPVFVKLCVCILFIDE